jgi:hypothetical protein
MAAETSGAVPRDAMLLALLADPGLPAEVAEDVAAELPKALSREVSDEVTWRVEVECERLALDRHGELGLADVAGNAAEGQERDMVIYLTDHPRRAGVRPVVADVGRSGTVALASLPALGTLHLARRTRALILHLVDELARERLATGRHGKPPRRLARPLGGLLTPIRRITPKGDEVAVRFIGTGARGHFRLVAGMVRANRPWRLVPALSGAFAGAVATGAYVLVSQQIWRLADALSPLRLVIASVFAVAAMIVWLIVDHRLWERPSGQTARQLAVLYNTATALTLTLGVLSLYVGLFALTLLAGAFLLPGRTLEGVLGHAVTWADYANIAWFATSLATVGGAIGSGLESDEEVREAAYGYRQGERRRRQDRDGGSGHHE